MRNMTIECLRRLTDMADFTLTNAGGQLMLHVGDFTWHMGPYVLEEAIEEAYFACNSKRLAKYMVEEQLKKAKVVIE